jgi:hypothetical protein
MSRSQSIKGLWVGSLNLHARSLAWDWRDLRSAHLRFLNWRRPGCNQSYPRSLDYYSFLETWQIQSHLNAFGCFWVYLAYELPLVSFGQDYLRLLLIELLVTWAILTKSGDQGSSFVICHKSSILFTWSGRLVRSSGQVAPFFKSILIGRPASLSLKWKPVASLGFLTRLCWARPWLDWLYFGVSALTNRLSSLT